MTSMMHTPKPWMARRKHPTATNAGISILGPEDSLGCRKVIAEIDSFHGAQANAGHIVKCVNLHDDLLAFIERIARMTQDGEEIGGREFVMENDVAYTLLHEVIDEARGLVAEAEGRAA